MNVSHPNILELIAVDINPLNGQCSMISEMMINGCIKEYTRKNRANRHRLVGWPPRVIQLVLILLPAQLEEAAEGLRYLHKRGIVHGDLKGVCSSLPTQLCALTRLQQNILITNDTPPRACLADFGLSTFIPGAQGEMSTTTAGGTSMFMAPELLCPRNFNQTSSRPTQPADIYAFGMVIYEVLTGFHPFHENKWGEPELVYNVMTGVRPTKPADAERIGFGNGTWELVEGCWVVDSTMRPAVDEVLIHLTRVAACSEVVGPTIDKPRESTIDSTLSDYSSKPFISLPRDNSHLDGQGHPQLFLSTSNDSHTTVTSDITTSPVSTRSVASATSTVISSIASVPIKNKNSRPRPKCSRFSASYLSFTTTNLRKL